MSAARKIQNGELLEWLEGLETDNYGYWHGKSPEPGLHRHRLFVYRKRGDAFDTGVLFGPTFSDCIRQAKIAMGAPVIPLRAAPRFRPRNYYRQRSSTMAEGNISTAGLDPADVLAALYNAARPLGMGILHYTPEPMTADQARELLKQQSYFDYVKGRVMKVRIEGDELNPRLYDRDNGDGAAADVINKLREAVLP